jgi:hypothetical protein
MPEISRFHFSRAILPALQFADPRSVNIEARDRKAFARKGGGNGKTHIAQTDNRNSSLIQHTLNLQVLDAVKGLPKFV